MKDERTCDLEKLLKGAPFAWGDIVKIHAIGEYSVAEFHPWEVKSSGVLTGCAAIDETQYYGWIGDHAAHQSWASMDAAIVGCIAYKHEGINHRAGGYFMRMIGQ